MTVAGCGKGIANFWKCHSATVGPSVVRTNGMVNGLALDDLNERTENAKGL